MINVKSSNCANSNCSITDSSLESANLFNAFFTSLCSNSNSNENDCQKFISQNLEKINFTTNNQSFEFDRVNTHQVADMLNNLDSSKFNVILLILPQSKGKKISKPKF